MRARGRGAGPGRRALVAGLAAAALAGCNDAGSRTLDSAAATALTGGRPDDAPAAIARYGCAACHTIPGIPGADGRVGPPLRGLADRHFIAGVLPNTPENLVRWIVDPQRVDSLTAMPTLGVSEPDARAIAAYLYTVR